jgi:predicted ATPase
MLNQIRFKNYKLFKDWQTLKLKPITVIIGKNSSGKSAAVKLPVLIEKSLAGDDSQPISIQSQGIELGGEFRDLLYRREVLAPLEIELEDEQELLSIALAINTGSKSRPVIHEWELTDKLSGKKLKSTLHEKTQGFLINNNQGEYRINNLSLTTEFIGPFRRLPERIYHQAQASSIKKLGIEGENTYSLLIEDALSVEKVLIKQVSDWYETNFEGWGIRINEDRNPYYEIELTRDSGRINVNLKDVGEGMSQALPLVTCAMMPADKDTLIIMEQPELHLHPSAHGALAQLFAESTKEQKSKRYLIETHSQNFVLRLRRLIAEGSLSPDDMALYFVDFDEENHVSNLKAITIDNQGEVDFWPDNIFNEGLDEVLAIRRAQREHAN